ncbi:hypothetical protein B0T25DRAFT_576829 [Lasiosphaeria hispida]|uniref:Uncharacterized protein n=1 Tax=Lasiosphaeria hispida TaxID=260671 RepID=A0AAJ0HXW7_9PEZI|nr:hypothetical protein B0T25DRAFT_576829 [Lasiosphaeria hispida]
MAAIPATFPSSQHHSGLPRQLSSIKDLSAQQQAICDDIIGLVAQAGKTGEVPSAESRAGFWALVFADGWNTNSTNRHPGEIPERRAVHSRIHIGKWDVPYPAGAPAYLKPNLNWSQFSLTYIVCDENGSAANDQFLRLTDGLTLAQAHSDAIKHFDKHESRRGLEVPQGGRPTMNAGEIPINTGQLVKLETCYSRIQNIIGLVHDSAAIATGSRGVRYADHREK